MQIDRQVIENAVKEFLAEQVARDPDYFQHILEEMMEDRAFGKLLTETDKSDNPSVPIEDIYKALSE